jgi:hypothetical protein
MTSTYGCMNLRRIANLRKNYTVQLREVSLNMRIRSKKEKGLPDELQECCLRSSLKNDHFSISQSTELQLIIFNNNRV